MENKQTNTNSLVLKWGTLKGWDFSNSEKGAALLDEYFGIGSSPGAMTQKDTPRQKEIILELIDLCDTEDSIYLDWDGKYVNQKEAKEYITNYGKK